MTLASSAPLNTIIALNQGDAFLGSRPAAPRQALRIVIVGGGATGCEIAANVQHLVAVHGGQAHITVLVRGDSF